MVHSENHHPLGLTGGSVSLPKRANFWRMFWAFSGPGYLISVGYMDPGNWATDIAGGSQFGYTLLSVVIISSLTAVILQALSGQLGIATGHDLAQLCRLNSPPWFNFVLWALAEAGIVFCDLAEVIGTAIAFKLLFGIPFIYGVVLAAINALILLALFLKGMRPLEALISSLIVLCVLCFIFEIVISQPVWSEVFKGMLPQAEVVRNSDMLYVAIGIIGATIMPHNLYLHSALVQTRAYDRSIAGRKLAINFVRIDSTLALSIALFVNAAILVLAAAAFHSNGHVEIQGIEDAYAMLTPVFGASEAATLFALALLASGTNATITATLAGQVVMDGFLQIRLPVWLRQLTTRGVTTAIVVAAVWYFGDEGKDRLMIFSQVFLSLQLPFAVVPLIMFVGSRRLCGTFAISRAMLAMAWIISVLLILLDMKLLYDMWP